MDVDIGFGGNFPGMAKKEELGNGGMASFGSGAGAPKDIAVGCVAKRDAAPAAAGSVFA